MSLPALQRPCVAVDIPLLAARYSVDTPDVPVKRTFEAQAAGVDQELDS